MRATNQGGSLAGFIIIGVLLTLILVGGLFGLNRYNAQRAADEIAATEEATSEEESTESSKPTTEANDESAPQSRTEQDSGDKTQEPQAQSAQPAGAAQSAQLPTTGQADTLMGFVAVTVLTFAVAHYTRSRA